MNRGFNKSFAPKSDRLNMGVNNSVISKAGKFVSDTAPTRAKAFSMLYTWLKANYPKAVIDAESVKLGDVVATGQNSQSISNVDKPWYEKVADTVLNILPSYAAYKGQQSLIKLNIERAKQGLPPVDTASVSPQVNVGISADSKRIVYFALGGAALIALVALTRKR